MKNLLEKITKTKWINIALFLMLIPFSGLKAQNNILQSDYFLTIAGMILAFLAFFILIIVVLKKDNIVNSINLNVKLLLYAGLFVLALCVLYNLFTSGSAVINNLIFTGLPYAAIAVFLIGSIVRYRTTEFKVSSLSTQFLEGKKLFLGSQLFHWSIIFLFFGHLTAFLFPKTVLLWNRMPIRLLILEVTAFAFGLSLLLGICLLIHRRLTQKRLMEVSNSMDMIVYLILLVQIVSGLLVAYSHRWGSSWFASSLSPYLKSVFLFNPDASVVVSLPWIIRLHIFSAFFIIAIIPFTRFMHFLVAPIDYLWRSYQQVYWNWDRKEIRTSTKHNNGKPYQNH